MSTMDHIEESMDPFKDPECPFLPMKLKVVDDYFDIFVTLRHLGVPFDPEGFLGELWELQLEDIYSGEDAWVVSELKSIALTRLLCHTAGKQDDTAVFESINNLQSLLRSNHGGKINSPVLRQYLAQRRAEIQSDLDTLTAYSSQDPLPAYSVLDSKPISAASDPAADGCVVCQGKETALATSWECLRKSAATVVAAMALTEFPGSSSGSVYPSDGAEFIWTVDTLNALFSRCHPFAGLMEKLKNCPVFTEDLLNSLSGFARFSIYKHMCDLMSTHGVVTKLACPRIVREWTDAQMWLHNLDAGRLKDARIMKEHGIKPKMIKAALFDPYKTDGMEEEVLGRGASPYVRAKLALMKDKMGKMASLLEKIERRT